MRLLNAEPGDVLSLTFSPEGEALAAAVEGQGVFLWNLGSNGTRVCLDPALNNQRLRTLSFDADGRTVGWVGGNVWTIYDRDERALGKKTLDGHGSVNAVVRTPDGTRIISQHIFPEFTLIGWAASEAGWEPEWTVSTKELSIRVLAVDAAGERTAVICQPTAHKPTWWHETDTRLDLRSAVSGVVQASGPCPYHEVQELAFSPDGTQLVGVHQMTLVIWNVPELGEPLLIRNDSRKHFTSARFHPSGRYLFTTSNDETVHVFDTATWERVSRFTWRMGRLRAVAVSADGSLAAAGNDKGEVVVWDTDL